MWIRRGPSATTFEKNAAAAALHCNGVGVAEGENGYVGLWSQWDSYRYRLA
jgi:hypothetical protein